MPRHKFATAITCIDGRVQQPITDWMKFQPTVHYVDLITEPGPDKLISGGSTYTVDDIVRKVSFPAAPSCFQRRRGNRTSRLCGESSYSVEEHIEHILEAARARFVLSD